MDMRTSNLRTYLESKVIDTAGSAGQKDRWLNNVLPEDELKAVARSVLFVDFEHQRRWQKMRPSDLVHHRVCPTLDLTGPDREKVTSFLTTDVEGLTDGEWQMAQALIGKASDLSRLPENMKAQVRYRTELRSHRASCSICKAALVKPSILISVTWAGRDLSREYAL